MTSEPESTDWNALFFTPHFTVFEFLLEGLDSASICTGYHKRDFLILGAYYDILILQSQFKAPELL